MTAIALARGPAAAIAALLALALSSCSTRPSGSPERPPGAAHLEHACAEHAQGGACTLYDASLVQLIARPELFNGRKVRVIGFVNLEFEGNGIYLSREDWRHAIYQNGLWIEPPASVRDSLQRYMIVEGTFNAAHRGHMGMWSGAIERITRFDPWNAAKPPALAPPPDATGP